MVSYVDFWLLPMISGHALQVHYRESLDQRAGAWRWLASTENKERNMNTVRISPVEVQVGVMVYQFLDAAVADGFFALASQGADADAIACKCLALYSRAVDCDHELGSWLD